MDDGPTIYTIPRYLTARAARLRRAALAYVLAMPLAIWAPLFTGLRGPRAIVVGAPIAVGLLALLQLAPLGAPRTMRRRYRRLTRQTSVIVLAAYCVVAAAVAIRVRPAFVALGTVALDVPVAAYLFVSLPVYLVSRPEDVSRP